jgi:hypothetical protein
MTSLAISWMDVFTWLLLIANAGGMLAYMPQVAAAWNGPSGANNVVLLARSYFTFVNLSSLLYVLVMLQDSKSAWVFAANLSFTSLLVTLLVFKRNQHSRRTPAQALSGARQAKTEMRKVLSRAQSLARKDPKGIRVAKEPLGSGSGLSRA